MAPACRSGCGLVVLPVDGSHVPGMARGLAPRSGVRAWARARGPKRAPALGARTAAGAEPLRSRYRRRTRQRWPRSGTGRLGRWRARTASRADEEGRASAGAGLAALLASADTRTASRMVMPIY